MLLLAGGQKDPNMLALAKACTQLQVPYVDYLIPVNASPEFVWKISADGSPFEQNITSAFIRCDVFAGLETGRESSNERAGVWYTTLFSWLLAHPHIAMLNRNIIQAAFNKPAALVLAQQTGLTIPDTVVTNSQPYLKNTQPADSIIKPVMGGGHCHVLPDVLQQVDPALHFLPRPEIVQNRLVAPEYRVFIIGEFAFAFLMKTESLDYRVKQDVETIPVAVPKDIEALLRQLMKKMNMNFGAADLKTHPKTGELVFLELNTSPMFAAFNDSADGELARAIVKTLAAGKLNVTA